MFVKLTNGKPVNYTLGQLRRDNPNTSFPKHISDETLASYDVYRVTEVAAPKVDNKAYRLTQDVENVDGVWTQTWKAMKLPEDQATTNMRAHRDNLLSQSDWRAIKAQETGTAMSAEWVAYRQALRDITSHANFPWLDDADWPVKPE